MKETRLIDADKMIKDVKENYVIYGYADFLNDFFQMVKEQPTVYAVRHGHWIWMGEQGDSRYMCSVCKCKEENVPTCNGEPTIWEYCPNCGAKMDEVTDETNK